MIYTYGCGELGLLAKAFFEHHKVRFIPIDINPATYENSKDWDGYEIVTTDKVPKNELILVCISTHSFNAIKKNLNDLGFLNVVSFFDVQEGTNSRSYNPFPIRSGWVVDSKFFNKDVKKVRSRLYDERSRVHYSQFYIWHSKLKEVLSKRHKIDCTNRYFIDSITSILRKDETFIDVGAYDGRVAIKFASLTRGQYKTIHCLEPDTDSYKKLKSNVQCINAIVHNIALGNSNKKIGFLGGLGYVSSIEEESEVKVQMMKLDSMEIVPSIIKYHLEGYELDALKGSIKTIKEYRPIVIVTTYHTEDGLVDIPSYLMDRLENYRFLWRNHNYMGQGSVMYCIPEERYK